MRKLSYCEKKAGFVSAISGTISMILGFIGFCVTFPPVCGGVCITGPLVAIFGIGIMGFLNKFSVWFIMIGGIVFLFGVFLMFKYRKKCDTGNVMRYLNRMKGFYKIEKCRNCECLQGFLVQLEIDGVDEKTLKKIKKMVISENIHKCLGCDPCPPGEVFTEYLTERDKTDV